MLYALTYSSLAVFVLHEREVAVLLERSRELNVAHEVTGLLVYLRLGDDRAAFLQVLEGAQRDVEETYARIQRDELHTGLTVLGRGPVRRRRFQGWSLRFASLDEPALRQVVTGVVDVDVPELIADRVAMDRVITAVAED